MIDLRALIQSIDIVEYISQYVDLTLKNGEFWGLSCFKEEKTPSFSVRQSPPVFYDYSSGIGGNVFTFVKAYNHCSNSEAVKILVDYVGCGKTISAIRPLAASLDCKRFRPNKSVNKIETATVLDDNYMNRYELRWDKLAIWEKEGISKESLERFQVRYDSFANRLVYPIRNLDGKIVNVGGRTLDHQWKEKKIRKYTYYFSWGQMGVIYALHENLEIIKKEREIILFEGCKSVLLADTWGIHNCGCLLTSHMNPAQLKILARLGCRVVLALDKDVRVRNDKHIKTLKNYVSVEYLWDREDLLGSKDSPVDKGQAVFNTLYNQRLRWR